MEFEDSSRTVQGLFMDFSSQYKHIVIRDLQKEFLRRLICMRLVYQVFYWVHSKKIRRQPLKYMKSPRTVLEESLNSSVITKEWQLWKNKN